MSDGWSAAWYALKAGTGCGMCADQGQEDSGWGVRFLQGSYADVFLWRSGSVHGYAVAIWKHGHVTEPTQLSPEQAAGFWLETLQAAAAIDRLLQPVKMNYLTLGNVLPHLHTHIVPRHADDPTPGRPLPFDLLDHGRQPEDRLQADVRTLRAAITQFPAAEAGASAPPQNPPSDRKVEPSLLHGQGRNPALATFDEWLVMNGSLPRPQEG